MSDIECACKASTLAEVMAQRDKLLAAMKTMVEGFNLLKDKDFPALAKCRKAIAECENVPQVGELEKKE